MCNCLATFTLPDSYWPSGTARTRTENQGIMRTTTAFAAPFEFVVWTIPSLYVSAVWSLHLPPQGSLARDQHVLHRTKPSPNLTDSTGVLVAEDADNPFGTTMQLAV